MIKITALVDNTPGGNRTMVHTHGLSFFIETYETSILFDFGPGPEFLQNAGRLGIDPLSAGYTVCSHSHYDHAAGYKALLQAGISCPFITGDHFFEEKYCNGTDCCSFCINCQLLFYFILFATTDGSSGDRSISNC